MKPKLNMVKLPGNIGKVGKKHEEINNTVNVIDLYQ
jgi:hypothetical protein